MNLNPFHPNYLNQMTFQKKSLRNLPTPKSQTKPQKSHRGVNEFNAQPANPKEDVKQLSAKFSLNNYFNTSHLHYTQQGYLIAFLRKQNVIFGKSFILFPQGIVACCNVVNKKITGWISICKKGQFYNISHFSAGKIHGVQYTYDLKCGLTVESLYQGGKLQSVKRGVADSQLSFERCLKNKDLVNLLNQTLNFALYEQLFPKIESPLGRYYGSKFKDMPNGLGVLITDQEWFYGDFSYGLLSGDGVMVFPNGNRYIGQFQQGMMKGFGNLLNNGNNLYKFNETIISEQEFKKKKNISSFYDSQQFVAIFGPIVHFYERLNKIYQARRRKMPQQEQVSFVEVQVVENENEEPKEENQSSNYFSPKADDIVDLFKANNFRKQESNTFQLSQRQNKPQNIRQTARSLANANQAHYKKEEVAKQAKGSNKDKRGSQTQKNKKDKWIIKDHEWNQIIQELGQQNISKEDGFSYPQEENIGKADPQQLKKNPFNSRISAQNGIKITDHPPDAMDHFQNQLIRKIQSKK